MKKELKICPVTKFVAWLILGLIVCIIGISNVFADEITFKVYDYQVYYDNFGSSVSQVGQTYNYSFNAYVSNNITTSANSYGAGVVINSGIPIISGHAYSISFYFIEKGNIALSSKNRIALGSSVSGAASSYTTGSYYATMITSKVVNGSTLQFAFIANASYQYIFIPWTTTSTVTQNYVFDSYLINDLGVASTLSQSDINNSLNSQTNTLNQSITNSQNAITSNSDNNRDLIIQNQNENTNNQIIADGNNARQQEVNSCTNAYMFNLKSGYTINGSNTLVTNPDAYYTEEYISIHSDVAYLTIKNSVRTTGYFILVYDSNKSVLDYWYAEEGRVITLPTGATYFRLSTTNANVMIYDGNKGCINRVGAIQDSITDDNVDSSSWSNFFNNFTTNTFGLTSIITAPLNLIQSLTNTTCTDLQIPLPYLNNKYLTLPCMTSIYSQYFGSFFTLYQSITYGIIAYWVCVRIFNLVKDFKNPDHDEIEVVDL